MFRAVLIVGATAALGMEAGAAVRVHRPTDAAQIVLQLGSSASEQQLATLRAAVRATPQDVGTLIRYVDALIEAGARSGTERYYGYAEQALHELPGALPPAVMLRRARLLQHRHAFREAEQVLSRMLEANWRDREARLMRAQVRLHLHDPKQALADCAVLTPFVDSLTSATCIAQSYAALGDLQRAQVLLARALESRHGDAITRSWSTGVAAEVALRLGAVGAAGRWYAQAFALDPGSHYVRITYADWLLSDRQFAEALHVARSGSSLADRARGVLAARDPQSVESRRLQLAWQEAAARGERAHLRDQARFELTLLHDAAKAHATALANFRERQEPDDALLLATTAVATHDDEALRAIEIWRQRYGYVDVRLDRLLGAMR
jgi:hypothetical protein